MRYIELVEIGFNNDFWICKIAFVVRLNKVLSQQSADDRHMYICLGADANIKTCYVTPGFKYRQTYRHKNSEMRVVDGSWLETHSTKQ